MIGDILSNPFNLEEGEALMADLHGGGKFRPGNSEDDAPGTVDTEDPLTVEIERVRDLEKADIIRRLMVMMSEAGKGEGQKAAAHSGYSRMGIADLRIERERLIAMTRLETAREKQAVDRKGPGVRGTTVIIDCLRVRANEMAEEQGGLLRDAAARLGQMEDIRERDYLSYLARNGVEAMVAEQKTQRETLIRIGGAVARFEKALARSREGWWPRLWN